MSVEGPDDGQPIPDGIEPRPKRPARRWPNYSSSSSGHEQKELRRIQTRIDDPNYTPRISAAFWPSRSRFARPDDKLADALAPTFQEAFKVSVKKDPQSLVDAISPVMGPAIRKSISDALERMVQSLNQTLEYGFSPKGLKWRFEAFRTGKPFAEVVFLHTLQYRVEQLFLIHRKDGLLLQHVAVEPGLSQDADMVSGMLTAIRDFVRDSFGRIEKVDAPRPGSRRRHDNLDRTVAPDSSWRRPYEEVRRKGCEEALQDVAEKIQIETGGISRDIRRRCCSVRIDPAANLQGVSHAGRPG